MSQVLRSRILRFAVATLAAAVAALPSAGAFAQTRLERLRSLGGLDDGVAADTAAHLPASVRVVRDVAYGPDRNQRFDVYLPADAQAARAGPLPVVFFVHGGGWSRGDKAMSRVVEPKVAHWVEQGWVVISTNYRMLPTPVAVQAGDVATALACAQSQAAQWGADPTRFALMGHSAGAHLIALVSAGAKTAAGAALPPWRGSVLLDSAVLDLPLLMSHRHPGLYDRAFGTDPQQWPAVSPYDTLARPTPPILAVCSSRRSDSCMQADRFAAKDRSLGGNVRVLREDLSHMEINAKLGEASDYTTQVDGFLRSLR